jgi:fructose-bisphosphate aldolase class I
MNATLAQTDKVKNGQGFIAALDQSGGSTPKALKQYGVDESAYSTEAEMFALVHAMRARIITSPAFHGDKIVGAILFEKTMDGTIEGTPTAQYLWNTLAVVPFLKIDQGLAEESEGCQKMKPIAGLEALLVRAKSAGIFGTKMRSVINSASESGIAAVVDQQFEIAGIVLQHGLFPIIEPEVSITSPDKNECEKILKKQLLKHLETLKPDQKIILKLTLPEEADLYLDLVRHEKVLRVVALSGGYSLEESCKRLAQNEGVIASFSRALTNDLKASQSDQEFNTALEKIIDVIYSASVDKVTHHRAA